MFCFLTGMDLEEAVALHITMLDLLCIVFAIVLFSGLLVHFMRRRIMLGSSLDIYSPEIFRDFKGGVDINQTPF